MRRDVKMSSFGFDTMLFRTALILAILQSSIGASNLSPLLYDNSIQSDLNTVVYPNPEAKVWNILTPDLNSDYVFNEDVITSEAEIPEEVLDDDHLVLQKRPNVKLIPRVGRKKRSLSEEDNKIGGSDLQEDVMKKDWTSDTDQDLFVANKRKTKNKVVFIPRIGKKNYADLGEIEEKRAIFIPRIGKKSASQFGELEEKRAVFIPRIGKKSVSDLSEIDKKRAIFVPRIGKKKSSVLDETEEKRAIFVPRIGKKDSSIFGEMEEKRAVFIPRIGRGALIPHMKRYNPQYRVSNRAVFIPRIG